MSLIARHEAVVVPLGVLGVDQRGPATAAPGGSAVPA